MWQAGLVAVVGIILAVCYLATLSALASSSSGELDTLGLGSQLHSFGTFVLLFGLALGGGLKLDINAMLPLGDSMGAVQVGISLVSMTTVLAIAVGNYFLMRVLRSGNRPAGRLEATLRAGLDALLLAVCFTLICLAGTKRMAFNTEISGNVAPNLAGVFFTVLLLVFLSQLAASGAFAEAKPSWVAGMRESAGLLVLLVGSFSVVATIAVLVNLDSSAPAAAYLLVVPLLGTVGSWAAALGFFGAIAPGFYGSAELLPDVLDASSMPVLRAWNIADGKGAWIFLLSGLLLVIAALWIGVRRPRTASTVNLQRTWQLPLFSLLIWIVLAAMTNYSADGLMDAGALLKMGAGVSVGITWYSVLFMALGAGLVSLLAEVLPVPAYRISPGLLALIGGKRTVNQWVSGHSASLQGAAAPPPVPQQPMVNSAIEPGGEPTIALPPVVPAPAVPLAAHEPAEQLRDPVAAAAPYQSEPAAPAELEPLSAAGKRRAKAIGFSVLGVALLIGLTIGAIAVLNSQRKPEAEVAQYLQLLETGQAAKANQMVDPGVDNAARAMLTDEVLAAAEQRLVVESVRLESKTANSASVQATYSINGERHIRHFTVDQGPKEYGVLDTWELNQALSLPVQLVSNTNNVATIGSVELPLSDTHEEYFATGYSADLYAYPGIYKISGPSSEYQSSSTETLRVDTEDEVHNATVTTSLAAGTEELVLEAVNAFAKACVSPPTNMDPGCPYQLQGTDLASFSVTAPARELSSLELDSFTSGDVDFKYKRNNDGDYSYDEEEITTSFRGEITWTDGKPSVEGVVTW